MPATDTEEALIADLTAVIRRAVALGRKLGAEDERKRILRAASMEPPAPSDAETTPAFTPGPRGDDPDAKPHPARKYPYGYVSSALEETLKAHPQGIEREAIGPYCREALGKDIDEEALRNAIKVFIRRGRAARSGNTHFWRGT